MAQQLFTFNEKQTGKFTSVFPKLHRTYTDNNKKTVICIVGQARMGKSAFLNCFNAHVTKKIWKFLVQKWEQITALKIFKFTKTWNTFILIVKD